MKKVFTACAVLTIVLGTGLVSASAAEKDFHCSGQNDPAFVKVEGQGMFSVDGLVITVDGPAVSFADEAGNPVAMQFCVKASTGNSGPLSGSSYTVEWTNNGGQTPDISYVVVYGPGDEEPCDHEGCEGEPS